MLLVLESAVERSLMFVSKTCQDPQLLLLHSKTLHNSPDLNLTPLGHAAAAERPRTSNFGSARGPSRQPEARQPQLRIAGGCSCEVP